MNPSMRLKVKGDTFFIPDTDGSVYFRNNAGSFRMEGSMIDRWIDSLLPAFNGEHTLEALTDGLPDQHRNRVYEIANVLHEGGFVRDVSEDRPHTLPDRVVREFAAQIEYLDSFGGSGAYRFQCYRQAKVLAVGCGPFLVSLVASLLESGLPAFSVLVMDPATTSRKRLEELAAHARSADPEVDVREVRLQTEGGAGWSEIVRPFDAILYVSQESGLQELRALHTACKEQSKALLPAVVARQTGMAGPLVHPDAEGCWESAWRRVHESSLCKDPELHTSSSTAEAMLANVIVFEWLKTATGTALSELKNKLFLLDLETLEGSWHSFVPHPSVQGREAGWLRPVDLPLEPAATLEVQSNGLLPYFNRLTSAETGIFHVWEEGDLTQLPLSLCRVQTADPLSEGPAGLLPDIVCAGMTHEEARREAGLAGIEAYVSRMVEPEAAATLSAGLGSPELTIGVGAGETVAECVVRGLQMRLAEQLKSALQTREPRILRLQLSAVEDERCLYYTRALTTMQGEPALGWSETAAGLPAAWVGTNGVWYGACDLNPALSLRSALQQALIAAQHKEVHLSDRAVVASSVLLEEPATNSITIESCEQAEHRELLQTAWHIMKRNRTRIQVLDLASEPFLKEGLAGVFGVVLLEEDVP